MLGRREDVRDDDRFAYFLDVLRGRHLGWVVQRHHAAVRFQHLVNHRRRSGDEIEVVFALEPLLDDLHMQQAEEAAAEAEAHRLRTFWLKRERGIVELELFERLAQVRIVVGRDRKQTREHARLHFLESGQRLVGRLACLGQRIADRCAVHVLDRRADPADFACTQRVLRQAFWREYANRIDIVAAPGRHHEQLVARPDLALHHAHERNDAEVIVEPGVDDQRLQAVRVAWFRRRNARDDRLEHFDHVEAGLGADRNRIGRVNADHGFDFFLDLVDVGGRQVDLVEHRHDLEAEFDRGVAVCDRLCLDALRGIDHEQGALAGRERAADFVAEVHVAGRVDKIELVNLAVARLIRQRHRLRLDRDAALALDRIGVEHLRLHLALLQAAADLDNAVGERGLAVIHMRDDGEIANQFHAIKSRIGRA